MNTCDTCEHIFLEPLTPQNYLSQSNKPFKLLSFNDSKNQTLVQDNYPYIHVTRIISRRKTNYIYKLLSLGFYPLAVNKTRRNSLNGTIYRIPDNYSVSVTIYQTSIICKTQYQNNGSVKYTISWVDCNYKLQRRVKSYDSATDARKSNKSSISGVKLFALDLECLEKHRDELNNSQSIHRQRSLEGLSSTQQNRRLKLLANDIRNNVQSLFLQHNTTSLKVEKVDLRYKNDAIEFNFKSLVNDSNVNKNLDSIVYACDDALISRDSLRRLAAVIPEINREYLISQRRIEINNIMSNKIPINLFTLNNFENGVYRTIKSILTILVSYLVTSEPPVLAFNDIIKIKIGGDGRQVGHQQNHVLITMCILNEKDAVLFPENQYIICLYNGVEKRELLAIAFGLFNEELIDLSQNGFCDSNGNRWPIEFWFSSDWKFATLVMGINAATSNFFCLYCDCEWSMRWDMNKTWTNSVNTK
ncbi:2569_t:CDS:2, partial [Cetraspora pellucida]